MRRTSPPRYPMKKLIRESNLIEGYDDPDFDAQGMVAWRYLLDQFYNQLDHGVICKVQKILTLKQTDLFPDERGYYRRMDVYVGGYHAPAPAMVKPLMDNWLLDFRDLDPKEAHIRFEKIHPFIDGNGRTGRLLLWWQQLHRGEVPTPILNVKKQEYYKWFQ